MKTLLTYSQGILEDHYSFTITPSCDCQRMYAIVATPPTASSVCSAYSWALQAHTALAVGGVQMEISKLN